MSDETHITAEDAYQVAQRAMARLTEVEADRDDLQRKIQELERDVTACRLRLSEMDEERDYRDRSLDEKVGMVREHAFQKASDRGGPVTLDYDAVIYGVFDGEPSAKHAYKLMRLAADAPGFEYLDEPQSSQKPKRLKCDPELAKTGQAFLPENKAVQEGSE